MFESVMFQSIMGLIFFILFSLVFIYLYEIRIFLRYIEFKQPDIWNTLGRPVLGYFPGNSLSNLIKSFYSTSIYEVSGFDLRQLRRIRRIKWLFTISIITMLIFFIAAFLSEP